MVNIIVDKEKKKTWDKNENLLEFIEKKEREIQGLGRILVRASGTENLIRVMVEAKEEGVLNKILNELVDKVKEELV